MIGTTVGGYTITEFLAEGGMGTVWLARHAVMQRDAVVKLLHPELGREPSIVERFINEARAAASINDPGIVQIFDVGHLEDQRPYIVMERLGGHTLAARIAQRRDEPARRTRAIETVHVLRLIVRTLVAAHARGIVHRDLKPENIFVVPDPDVVGGERTKIVDFGIAKLASGPGTHKTRAGSMFGTPAYMAPEQCEDAASVDARADLYAVGCIGYEMLCGRPPFDGGGLAIIAAQLRDEPVPLRERDPAIPVELEAIVMRLLRKLPDERYAQTSELYAALDSLALDASRLHTPLPFPATGDAVPTRPQRPEARAAADAASAATVAPAQVTREPTKATRNEPTPPPTNATRSEPTASAVPARSSTRTRAVVGAAALLLVLTAIVTFVVTRPDDRDAVSTAGRTDDVVATHGSAPTPVPPPTPMPSSPTEPSTGTPTATPSPSTTTATTPTPATPTTTTPTTTRRPPTRQPTAPTPTEPAPAPAPTPTEPAPAPTPTPTEPAPAPTPTEPAPAPTTTPPPPPEPSPPAPTTTPPPEPSPPAPTTTEPAPRPKRRVEAVNAGPIWNNADATKKCPNVCKPPSRWKGGWRTVKTGRMSTCDCVTE